MTELGEALRVTPLPRSPELCARVVAKHAPWWGFAFYIVLYLALAGSIGALLIWAFIDAVTGHTPGANPTIATAIIPEAIAVGLTAYLLVRWVRRRRGGLRALPSTAP